MALFFVAQLTKKTKKNTFHSWKINIIQDLIAAKIPQNWKLLNIDVGN